MAHLYNRVLYRCFQVCYHISTFSVNPWPSLEFKTDIIRTAYAPVQVNKN